eukprot:7333011-Karenia_brevis.AAC.1
MPQRPFSSQARGPSALRSPERASMTSAEVLHNVRRQPGAQLHPGSKHQALDRPIREQPPLHGAHISFPSAANSA